MSHTPRKTCHIVTVPYDTVHALLKSKISCCSRTQEVPDEPRSEQQWREDRADLLFTRRTDRIERVLEDHIDRYDIIRPPGGPSNGRFYKIMDDLNQDTFILNFNTHNSA